ncbi:uncharacterized protein N7482_004498 [Penicillium canariense]|uniref:A-kinase anchor protein 7-like phosphoesterase domain-containing protein n=1 Tax=Penicillium canariense TaxID=189055 RepID=A0A9W9I8U2_9EURO|nr:uncharacterized protein N7482_004498 [Penicillium canariense]KAJ5168904.1 hypothetical protein N7482_004498 [Penicillium canariense]
MTGGKRHAPKHQQKEQQRPRRQRPEKRPQLTHFLCLPLVNSTSLPQLEASIAAFKTAYPPVPFADFRHSQHQTPEQDASHAFIPEGAVRPVGTLHLTLGVMSLTNKERLDEALAFFKALDLVSLMREAERVADEARQERDLKPSSRFIPDSADSSLQLNSDAGSTEATRPFSVSLESLHALPRAKAATVLHASPVDPTGRLYPFCLMLRDKFIEAGFMQAESKNGLPGEKGVQTVPDIQEKTRASSCEDLVGDDRALLDELPKPLSETEGVAAPNNQDPYAAALARKPRPRPLLLHATLVNTIYVRGRRKIESSDTTKSTKKGKNTPKRLEFDARDLLARYRDYYVDEARRTTRVSTATQPGISTESPSLSRLVSEEHEVGPQRKNATATSRSQYPFVWAHEIPLDSVCICEMGAKKLDIGGPEDQGWNARLGEKYTVIAERSLDSSPRPSPTGKESEKVWMEV